MNAEIATASVSPPPLSMDAEADHVAAIDENFDRKVAYRRARGVAVLTKLVLPEKVTRRQKLAIEAIAHEIARYELLSDDYVVESFDVTPSTPRAWPPSDR